MTRSVVAIEDRPDILPVDGVGAAEWFLFDRNARMAVEAQLRGQPAPEPIPRPQGLEERISIPVRASGGRWLCLCPWCWTAMHASREDRRFWCVKCLNEQAGGKAVLVEWPAPEMVEAIELELAKIPDPRMRNWRPGQDLEYLARETARALKDLAGRFARAAVALNKGRR